MIDKHEFSDQWKSLCRRFKREMDPEEMREYHEYLSPMLTTEEFTAASRRLWASREFFPRPDDFLERLRPTREEQAVEQWQLCERVMEGEVAVLKRMSEAGRKTVALLGGTDRLRNTPLDEVHFRRAEFLRLYEHSHSIHERERQALQPWTDRDTKRLRDAAGPIRLLGGEVLTPGKE